MVSVRYDCTDWIGLVVTLDLDSLDLRKRDLSGFGQENEPRAIVFKER